jgi:DNA-binding MarR family transcriptional regulator
LRPLGLTHTRFLVLHTTALLQQEANDAVSQSEIAQRCELDDSTVSNLARRLTEDGLLDRGPNGVDARAWRVIVTSAGHRVLRRARPAVDTASSQFFKPHRSA